MGLTVNYKMEYLIVSRSNKKYGLEQHIELEGHTFRKASQFKYTGLIITQNNKPKIEVLLRIKLANKGLEKVLKSRPSLKI